MSDFAKRSNMNEQFQRKTTD